MRTKVKLVDINPSVVAAWREIFSDNPEVEVVEGSMLEQKVDAWVSPTNAAGNMDGGLDGVIKSHLGQGVQTALHKAIARQGGRLSIGDAVCVESPEKPPRFLISTPTMEGSSDDVSKFANVAWACAAAFQAIHMRNNEVPGSIGSVAVPGLGAATGKVPPERCASLMYAAYNLFRARSFQTFDDMREAMNAIMPAPNLISGRFALGEAMKDAGLGDAVLDDDEDEEQDGHSAVQATEAAETAAEESESPEKASGSPNPDLSAFDQYQKKYQNWKEGQQ